MFSFRRNYFILFLLLLATEILIALYAHDEFIRPFVGDILVVILIYCFVKSFLKTPVIPTAIAVLAFSFIVEGLQYLKIVNILGLENNRIASTVIGTTFQWTDLLAYSLGIVLVIIVEKQINRN